MLLTTSRPLGNRRSRASSSFCLSSAFPSGSCSPCFSRRSWDGLAADQIEHFCPGLCPEAAGEAREGLRTSAALREENGFCPKPQFVNSRLDLLRLASAMSPD